MGKMSGQKKKKRHRKVAISKKNGAESQKFATTVDLNGEIGKGKKKAPGIRGPIGARWSIGLAELLGSAGRRLEVLAHGVPVDHVPPGREIVRAPVLVEQIVGVLPDVDTEDRGLALHIWAVLVGG